MYNREELIEYYKNQCCDLIPYNDPEFEKKLQELAESCADEEINGYPSYVEYLKNHPDENNNIDIDINLPF